jgi:hypothetical protein
MPNDKKNDDDGLRNLSKYIKVAVILSILPVLAAELYILNNLGGNENYAVLYLVPGSYSNYVEGNRVFFQYGIEEYGRKSNSYILDVYMGDELIAQRDLKNKEGLNEVEMKVPEGVHLPVKVRLVLRTDHGENDVHFWLKDKEEDG